MELFCIGDKTFCELFSFVGAEYAICSDPEQAAECIAARPSGNEIILVSEVLLTKQNRDLENLLNSHTRVVIPVPALSGEGAADPRSTLRKLLGGL